LATRAVPARRMASAPLSGLSRPHMIC
jgi:hypothetical protein